MSNAKSPLTVSAEILKRVVLNAIAIAISVASVYPIVWLAISSLKTKVEFIRDSLSLPAVPQFVNYARAFEYGHLLNSSLNSALYVVINIALVSAVAVITGYFMARYEFKGKKIIYFTYLIGFLVPLYGLLVPVFLQFRLLDLVNERIALVFPYYAMLIPLAIFLIESFIRGIPRELDEAATIDGCNVGRLLIDVIFPLSGPAIATVVILTSLLTWNEFGFAAVLIRDIDLRTASVAVRTFQATQNREFTYLMAALMSVSIPIIVTYLVFSKFVISGITTTGVKG